MRKSKILLLALPLTIWAGAAFAHAQLQTASPSVGGSVGGSPSSIVLNFSEGVEARYSKVSLTGPNGPVALSKPVTADGKATLSAQIGQPLRPGRYDVRWEVLSVDTHRTSGSFSFEVR